MARDIEIDETLTNDGGREYVRMVSCAHCGSPEVSGRRASCSPIHDIAWMSYKCLACERHTYLHAFTLDGGRVYVTRARAL